MTTEILGRSPRIESSPLGCKSLLVTHNYDSWIMIEGSFCIIKCGDVLMKIRIKNIK